MDKFKKTATRENFLQIGADKFTNPLFNFTQYFIQLETEFNLNLF